MKRFLKTLSMGLAVSMLLVACGSPSGGGTTGGSTGGEKKDVAAATSAIEQKHPAIIENEGTAVADATLKVGVVSDSPFKGILHPYLYTSGVDNAFLKYTMAGAFPIDSDFKLILDSDETPIKMSIDKEKKEVTLKINPKFKWSNGETVTTKDIVKTYEIVANADYIKTSDSIRFSEDMQIIEGIVDYNKGKADKISGLEVIDDSTMKIHLTKINPGVLWGGPFISEFVNAKAFEGIAMNKVVESDALRKNPLSYGPYVIKSVVPGEKIVFEANPYYFRGEAKVKKLEMEILPPSQQVAATKAGKYDIILQSQADSYPQYAELDNIKIASRQDLYESYLGFKLGKWDKDKGEVVTNPEAKMADPKLRQAMAYAIDNDSIGEKFFNGLRFTAAGPIAPIFKSLYNPSIPNFKYDLEKAKALLDEAGFKDTNGDGIREDKKGQPLKINFAMMSGSEISEPLSQYYLQQWKEIGLDVALVDGRLLEFNNFYERVETDDPAIDCYSAAWGLASDPNPSGFYGKSSNANYPRYTSEKIQSILDKISSEDALDPAKMKEFYDEFQQVAFEEVPFIPFLNRVDFLPVNKRVKNYDFTWDTKFDWSKIELTAAEPIKSTK
jgi:oligopeptide ABC superfamily ATP binding cassette transporter, binding protein